MKNRLESQMTQFNLSQAKECIKKLNSGEYDKMIFNEEQNPIRANYLYTCYKAVAANRSLNRLSFPMHEPLRRPMAELEGGVSSKGEKAIMESDELIKSCSNFDINPIVEEGAAGFYFDFPLDVVDNDNASTNQRLYYIPEETKVSTCDECSGHKYVQCDDLDCSGRHQWDCVDCNARGVVTCHQCAGQKRVDCGYCDGAGKTSCSSCGGDGKRVDKMDTLSAVSSSTRSTRVVKKTCSSCSGKGQKRCTSCNNGKVTCSECNGNGRLTCSPCKGNKKITCEKCYGDKEKYGKIDCPVCKATGETGTLAYVASSISNYEKDSFINIGEDISELEADKVLVHVDKNGDKARMFTNLNDTSMSDHHDIIKNNAENFRSDLGLNVDQFEKVLAEDIYYEVIPCVQVTYTHMLTNTEHKLSIINVFEKPELVFHSQAEATKRDLKNAGKAIGGVFGKLFKSKKYKQKEDRKKEIKLMIFLAKVDGMIEDQEKKFLADKISNLDKFTAKEKQEFFDLMNARDLPELKKEDVSFSTPERGKEAVNELINLASSDGEIEPREQKLIDDINALMS